MQKRDIATYVILSIITCGIYYLVVTYQQLESLAKEGATPKIPAWAVILCHLITLGVVSAGGALLGFTANDSMNQVRANRGLPVTDNMVLWTVLGAFIPVVTGALLQDTINKTLDGQ